MGTADTNDPASGNENALLDAFGAGDETGTTEDDAEDDAGDDESSPAEDLGFWMGWIVAAVAVGLSFFGPVAAFEVSLGAAIPFEGTGVSGLGPIPYVVGTTFVLAFGGWIGVETVLGEEAGSETDLAIGLIIPTVLVALLFVVVLFLSPVVHYLLAGELLYATLLFLFMAVVGAIAINAPSVVLAAALVGFLYLLLPALVGAYLASGLTSGLGVIRP